MSSKSKRVNRVAELIQSVIARLLQREINDPRLQAATITGVDLSPDGKMAIVFFSLLDADAARIKETEKLFENASGYFRFQLSSLTELRHTPKLTFKYDVSLMNAERVSRLIRSVDDEK